MKLDPKVAAKSRKQYQPEVMAEPSSAPADLSNTRFQSDEPMFSGIGTQKPPSIKGQDKYKSGRSR
jgi:hypothetical protein